MAGFIGAIRTATMGLLPVLVLVNKSARWLVVEYIFTKLSYGSSSITFSESRMVQPNN